MPKRSLPILILLVLLLAACAPLSPQSIANSSAPSNNAASAPEDSAPAPEATLKPTLTPTPLDAEVVVLTNEPPNIVLTAVNLQLDENHIRLTEAANQIATLSAETYLLETQVVAAKTQAAATAVAQAESGFTSSNTSSSEYKIPSNVHTIVTIAEKAYIWVPYGYNENNWPIMDLHEPRVFQPPGTESWVYKDFVKADGGALYYEVYDPDGDTPEYKIYYKGTQIQIRLPNGSPNPANFPANVAKAKILEKAAVHVVVGYNNKDKPIMDTLKPYVHYDAGKELILYPKFVVADGGSYWYPIYDPDGKPSAYLMASKVEFLYVWD